MNIQYRFANADFVLARSLDAYKSHPYILVTYDIACQYVKKIAERFGVHSPDLVDAVVAAVFAVPKLHVQGHKEDCQYNYALSYISGAGRFGGETIETTWSELNRIAAAVREMGPGMRKDHINDHLGDINWRKVQNIGAYNEFQAIVVSLIIAIVAALFKSLKNARRYAEEKRTFFKGLTVVHEKFVEKWKKLSTEASYVNDEWESVYSTLR